MAYAQVRLDSDRHWVARYGQRPQAHWPRQMGHPRHPGGGHERSGGRHSEEIRQRRGAHRHQTGKADVDTLFVLHGSFDSKFAGRKILARRHSLTISGRGLQPSCGSWVASAVVTKSTATKLRWQHGWSTKSYRRPSSPKTRKRTCRGVRLRGPRHHYGFGVVRESGRDILVVGPCSSRITTVTLPFPSSQLLSNAVTSKCGEALSCARNAMGFSSGRGWCLVSLNVGGHRRIDRLLALHQADRRRRRPHEKDRPLVGLAPRGHPEGEEAVGTSGLMAPVVCVQRRYRNRWSAPQSRSAVSFARLGSWGIRCTC